MGRARDLGAGSSVVHGDRRCSMISDIIIPFAVAFAVIVMAIWGFSRIPECANPPQETG